MNYHVSRERRRREKGREIRGSERVRRRERGERRRESRGEEEKW